MLEGMLAKGRAFKQQEQVDFAKFSEYCDQSRKDGAEAIHTAGDHIVQLKASIGKALSDAETLAEDIQDLEDEVAKNHEHLDKARKLQAKEEEDYKRSHQDLTESIEAVGKATQVVKSKSKDVPQSLLQVQQSSLLPAEAKAAITSFIALGDSVEDQPKPMAYESQTGGITAILEKLKLKFEDQIRTLEKEEANTKANFELLDQKLVETISDDETAISEKTAAKAHAQEHAAVAKGDLDVTENAKEADEKKLSDLNVECDATSKEYEKNQVTRAAEIKAMEECVKILGSDKVSGTAEKHNVAASLLDDSSSFAQLRRTDGKEHDKRKQLVRMLEQRAKSLSSKYLALVAARATSDPMMKVKKLIKDMIVKLMEEANQEADQKGYCDTELATNKATREWKSHDVEELTAQLEQATADLAQMKLDVAELSKEISEIKAEQKKATELRSEEKALNSEAISEAKEAQIAVERATQVMKEFYGKAKQASFISFIQKRNEDSSSEDSDDSMEDFLDDSEEEDTSDDTSKPYQGMQDSADGLIGMLEVILSDFAKLEAEKVAAEDEDTANYNKFMEQSENDAAVKGVELEHIQSKADATEESIRNLTKELKATQVELDAAMKYYEKLKPDCVDTGLSYQDRVEARRTEIESLQEALKVLSDD
jgi:hypothetical protein